MEENLIEQPNLEPEENHIDTTSTSQEGSNYGKFKNVDELLNAYNQLEAEFTRKSQKLSEFQKNMDNFAVFENKSVDEILNNNTDKERYKKEILELLSSDTELDKLPNKYHVAFKIITESEKKTSSKLNNPDYLDNYLNNNSELKDRIILSQLSKLNNIPHAPSMISGDSSGIFFTPSNHNPKSIKDAGDILSKMLK